MAKPRPAPRKSERSKVIVVVALAVIFVIVLVSQFSGGDGDSDDFEVMRVVGGSPDGAQASSKASSIQSKATDTRPDLGIGAANRVEKTIGGASGPIANDAKVAPVSRELPKIDHATIGQYNPFYGQTDLPASDLSVEAGIASAGVDELSELSPQIRALYVTPDGAVALVDGRIVPVSNSKVAIETIRAKWGNDFSHDRSATEQ